MLNNDNKILIYKYDYGSLIKRLLSYLIQFMANSCAVIFIGLGVMSLMMWLNSFNGIIKNLSAVVLFTLFFVIFMSFLLLTFLPRKIVLKDNYIKIDKHAINFFPGESWLSVVITYQQVVSCEKFENINYDNAAFIRQKTYPCTFYNKNSLVKIVDKYGKKYYIPIKNADDFIEKVNERINGNI